MKILLTGSNGMVGKNILEHPKAQEFDFLTPNSKELNLLNYSGIESYLSAHKPDLIIHAAGKVGGIQANIQEPVEFLTENMMMAMNLIQCAFKKRIANFINLGSSCMYPRNAPNPLSEELILKGELEPTNEGYALAKIAAVKLCEYVNKQDPSLLYKTVIPCNLYGRHDKFGESNSHMIPAVIKKIYEAKINNNPSIEIWGDGTARREFMYAQDLADFIFYAINNLEMMPQNINVGLGYDFSIFEYYQTIANCIGYKGIFNYNLSKPVGMKQKLVDTTKLKNFGWESTTSLSEGINNTLNFYLENSQ